MPPSRHRVTELVVVAAILDAARDLNRL